MRPTRLLKQQHRQVITALRKLEKSKNAQRLVLLDDLSNELVAHLVIEHELFYPRIREHDGPAIFEALEEHALCELALKRLRATVPRSDAFQPRVTALRHLFELHVTDEERIFARIEKRLYDGDLDALGARMKARFDELNAMGFEAVVPNAMTQTSADVARSTLEGPEGLERYFGETLVH